VPRSIPSLIFDLDGTLTDSKPGILGCLREVLAARDIRDAGPLDRFIGPPVEDWVKELLPGGSAEDHAALAREYRACYDRVGWSNNSVFPGIAEILAQLHAEGFPLYVCTSKQDHFAVRILEKLGLAKFFAAVYGDKLEYSSHSKIDLLARILSERGLGRESAERAPAWMVGDRSFDFEAAHANDLCCVAAAWGYGSAEEWAQADAVARTPADVRRIVVSARLSPSAGNRRVIPTTTEA
jgi:phosphoglycolate phosphatase